ERGPEALVVGLARRAVRPVDRCSAKRSCAGRGERPLRKLALRARAERCEDQTSAGAFDPKDDGVGPRPCSGFGDEGVDKRVEVERQRLRTLALGVDHARDRLLDAGRECLQMTAYALEDDLQ